MGENWADAFIVAGSNDSFNLNAEIYRLLRSIPTINSSFRDTWDIFSSEFSGKGIEGDPADPNLPDRVADYLEKVAKFFKKWLNTETQTRYTHLANSYAAKFLQECAQDVRKID